MVHLNGADCRRVKHQEGDAVWARFFFRLRGVGAIRPPDRPAHLVPAPRPKAGRQQEYSLAKEAGKLTSLRLRRPPNNSLDEARICPIKRDPSKDTVSGRTSMLFIRHTALAES